MVTPDDIAVELGRPTPDQASVEYRQWTDWISQALFLIKNRLGDPTLLDPEAVDYVVRQAVATHARHPDGASQVSVSVDDTNVLRSYGQPAGRIVILPEWWALLTDDSSDGYTFGSVQMYGQPDTSTPDVWTTTTTAP